MKMAAIFLQVKICSNGMIGIHSKNASKMLRATEVQSLIQDLCMLQKPFQERQTLRSLMK